MSTRVVDPRPAWSPRRLRHTLTTQPLGAWVSALATFVAYLTLAVQQWRRFESPSYDLGIFTQLLDRYAHLRAPIVHIKSADYNLLGDHFHPLLTVLAPVYALVPSAFTLLVLQALLLAVSTFFVAKIAHVLLGDGACWALGFAYGFSWGVQQAARVQFHEVALGAPILAIALWALVRRRWVTAAVWSGLLCFVKEDLPLTVAVFGPVLAWRSRRWVLGGVLAAWGLVWLGAAMAIIPRMNPVGKYDHGKNLDLAAVAHDPLTFLGEMVTDERRMSTLLLLCICVLFTLAWSDLALLLLPTLAWRFLSTNDGFYGPGWHYSLMLMPTAYVACADGCARLRRRSYAALRGWGVHGPAMALAVTIALFNQMPLWQLRDPARWRLGPRQEAAREVVAMVPKGALIDADVSLMNQLVVRGDVYYVGNKDNPVCDWMVVDNLAGGWSSRVDAKKYAESRFPKTRWEKVFDAEGYQVARRVG